MVLIRNHRKATELATLDPKTGNMKFYTEKDNPELATLPIKGHYSLIAGQILCFYKYDNKFFFRIDDKTIELDNDTHVELFKRAKYKIFQKYRILQKYRIFQICKKNEIILNFEYLPEKIDPPLELDFISSFVEEEDFDLCLYVRNVANDPERRDRIYTR